MVNTFILNNKGKENIIEEKCAINVERDKRKPYWDYVQQNIMSALKECLMKF